jgi:hypothetical protein
VLDLGGIHYKDIAEPKIEFLAIAPLGLFSLNGRSTLASRA